MSHSKSTRLTRKLLTVSFFLLAVAAMLTSPAPRTVRAESCSACYTLYQECITWCNPAHPTYDNCMLSCEFDRTWCLFYCEP